ncbi:MAG: hypothetical protein OXB92_07425 [Acidimicrobiaceae bacterium]|nr:hypothetical protein [Acidimicrobiia bacterium]MCY4493668.1 hypothetical protein [Acidimicrobiaceae bacterium]
MSGLVEPLASDCLEETPGGSVSADADGSDRQPDPSGDFTDLLSFVEWATRNRSTVQTALGALLKPLKRLLSGAAEFHGAVTVGDALQADLGHLARVLGIAPALDCVKIEELEADHRVADTVCERLAEMLASVPPAKRLILDERLFTDEPVSLSVLGRKIGLTPEAMRRNQIRVRESVDRAIGAEISVLAVFAAQRLGPVVSCVALERVVADLLDDGPSTAEVLDLARRILKSELNYRCIDGICLDPTAVALVARLRGRAGVIADDVGLIDEETLREHLPSAEWEASFPRLIECCGFARTGDRLALRDTAKARTKAALLDIGRVATKEEIASVLGLDPGRVSSQLSGIPSVARADKTRWGLAEWIDDEYDGISGEIIQRINEDGGAVSLKRLVEELPRLFGVSEASVRAYADAPQFAMRDGYVSLADESSVTLRSLDDVIDGRDAGGNAYWSFAVEDRYFDGHSLAGLPPELASELGCSPNSAVRVRVDHPAGCRDLSVNWRLTSLTGPSLGYLSGPLRRLGVSGGDRVSLVIKAPGVVEFRRRGETGSADSRRPTSADSLLKRMKKRRAVL